MAAYALPPLLVAMHWLVAGLAPLPKDTTKTGILAFPSEVATVHGFPLAVSNPSVIRMTKFFRHAFSVSAVNWVSWVK